MCTLNEEGGAGFGGVWEEGSDENFIVLYLRMVYHNSN